MAPFFSGFWTSIGCRAGLQESRPSRKTTPRDLTQVLCPRTSASAAPSTRIWAPLRRAPVTCSPPCYIIQYNIVYHTMLLYILYSVTRLCVCHMLCHPPPILQCRRARAETRGPGPSGAGRQRRGDGLFPTGSGLLLPLPPAPSSIGAAVGLLRGLSRIAKPQGTVLCRNVCAGAGDRRDRCDAGAPLGERRRGPTLARTGGRGQRAMQRPGPCRRHVARSDSPPPRPRAPRANVCSRLRLVISLRLWA